MTLEAIVTGIFTDLGEPSDLEIHDLDSAAVDPLLPGWRALVDIVNQSQLELVAWKFPNGQRLRMRLSDDFAVLQTKKVTGTVGTVVSQTILELTGLIGPADIFKGRLVVGTTSGATGLVMTSAIAVGVTTAYLLKVSGTFVAGEAVTLYQREYLWNATAAQINPALQDGIPYLATNGAPLEIISVTDTDTASDLGTNFKTDHLGIVSSAVATPASFVKIPSGVRFDVWPDAEKTYLVRYQRGPRALAYTDLAVEPEIPPQFHKALRLMGLWWGYRRMQETTDAYSVKRDLDDFLLRTKTEYDFQDEMTKGQIKFYPDGRT